MKEADGHIGRSQRHQLLILVDVGAAFGGQAARQRGGVSQGDESHSERGHGQSAGIVKPDVGTVAVGKPEGMTPKTATPWAERSKTLTTTVAPTTARNTAGTFGRQTRRARIVARQASPINSDAGTVLPSDSAAHEAADFGAEPVGGGAETEQLRKLADQHDDGQAVEVADPDRPGQKLGHHSGPGYPRHRADWPP